MAKPLFLAAIGGAALLAGCSLAPAYHPPAIATPAAFHEAGPWVPAAASAPALNGTWWQGFADPRLAELETRLQRDNPTLAQAVARHDGAQAYVGELRSRLLPTIDLGANLTANRQSDNRPLRGSNQPDQYGADTLGASAVLDLDLWGGLRNSLAAGKAEAQASADDVAAIKLALEAELADDYFALRGLDRQIGVLSAAVDDYTRADTLTSNRFKGGIASGVDVGRSGAQLADAQAQLADVRIARGLLEHAIASLVGVPASDLQIAAANSNLDMPPLPAILPSTLLERRPDVAAAERRMFSANREIGVTRAAFFPSIGLGGSGGFQSTALSGILAAPNLFWSVGPNAVFNLFDGGRRKARMEIARAKWAEATGAYRQTVLQAFQQVEDSLLRLHYLGDEAAAQQRATAMSEQAASLSYNRYVKGTANFLDVVTAQTAELSDQRRAIQVDTLRLQAAVALIQATGGGWQESPIHRD